MDGITELRKREEIGRGCEDGFCRFLYVCVCDCPLQKNNASFIDGRIRLFDATHTPMC